MKRETGLSADGWKGVMYALQKMVRTMDSVIPLQNNRIYILSFNDKKMAKEIGERVQVKLTQGNYIPKGVNVQFTTYSFPKDARSKDEFVKACRVLFGED